MNFYPKNFRSEITVDSNHYLMFYCCHNPLWLPAEDMKLDNFQCNMLGRWVDHLIDQASDGPSIILIG